MESSTQHWLVTLGLVVLAILAIYYIASRESASSVNSFDECVAAGYPATLSYPSTCRTPDGRIFTQEVPSVERSDLLPASPAESGSITSYDECAAAGYPVTLSYPATCRTPDGQIFTQQTE